MHENARGPHEPAAADGTAERRGPGLGAPSDAGREVDRALAAALRAATAAGAWAAVAELARTIRERGGAS